MTLKLEKRHIQPLERLFELYDNNDIEYVVLRRYDGYPNIIPGDDVKKLDFDMLVSENDFNKAIELGKGLEFTPRNNIGKSGPRTSRLATKAVQNPKKIITQPAKNLSLIAEATSISSGSVDPEETLTPYELACKNKYAYKLKLGEVVLDLKNHLAHVSPMNGKRYRLEPQVEQKMLQRRIKRQPFYVPSPPDELTHLIAHSIFEYEGDFTKYYTHRCETLRDGLNSEEDSIFREILEFVFFNASDLVYSLAMEGQWDSIRSSLEAYAKY